MISSLYLLQEALSLLLQNVSDIISFSSILSMLSLLLLQISNDLKPPQRGDRTTQRLVYKPFQSLLDLIHCGKSNLNDMMFTSVMMSVAFSY